MVEHNFSGGPASNNRGKKIQLTYALACEFLSALRVEVGTEEDELNILCLEGASPLPELEGLIKVTGNIPDRYNDSVVLFWKGTDSSGEGESGLRNVSLVRMLRVLRATTEPGRYYTEINPHPGGAAHLVWGRHLYKRGKHRGKPALVSATGMDRVWRDRDADFSQDLDEKTYKGRFGIHVHAGGSGESIGRWSAGCIAICGGYEGDAYTFFLDRVKTHPGKVIGLTLWGARDFSNWFENRMRSSIEDDRGEMGCVEGVRGVCVTGVKDVISENAERKPRAIVGMPRRGTGVDEWRPTLRYGIRNPWVADIQKLLNHHLNERLAADADWGPATQKIFLKFQQESGLGVDGICGPATWKKLIDSKSNLI